MGILERVEEAARVARAALAYSKTVQESALTLDDIELLIKQVRQDIQLETATTWDEVVARFTFNEEYVSIPRYRLPKLSLSRDWNEDAVYRACKPIRSQWYRIMLHDEEDGYMPVTPLEYGDLEMVKQAFLGLQYEGAFISGYVRVMLPAGPSVAIWHEDIEAGDR